MSISHKFTIESLTIVSAVAILALAFSGMLGNRVVPGTDKQVLMEHAAQQDQSKTSEFSKIMPVNDNR